MAPNNGRSRAATARAPDPDNTGKEHFQRRHDDRGRPREYPEYPEFRKFRDFSPGYRAYLECEDPRAARRYELEFLGYHDEEYFVPRDNRSQGSHRGYGRGRQ